MGALPAVSRGNLIIVAEAVVAARNTQRRRIVLDLERDVLPGNSTLVEGEVR